MIAISFILPIYNTPIKLLNKGINKLISFETEKLEIILVDDGSKQKIAEICDNYAKQDPRIKVFHQKNQGVSVARNRGIKNAKGKYIIFVDPDDYVLDEVIDIDYFNWESSDIILFNYIRKTKNGTEELISIKESNGQIKRSELIKNTLFCNNQYDNYYAGAIWAKAFKREFLNEKNILFDVRLRKAQDRVFMLYVYKEAVNITIGNKTTYVYYENMQSICNTYKPGSSQRSETFAEAVEKFLKDIPDEDIEKQELLAKTYLITYFEMLYLDIFNKNNLNKYRIKRKIAQEKYIYLNIRGKINSLSFRHCNGFNEKIKFFLIKNKLFFLLNMLIKYRQEKRL